MKILSQLKRFRPWNQQEARDAAELIRRLEDGETLFDRENTSAHLTASAWVTTPDRSRVLMAYHNLYKSWAWLGGHADGECDLRAVARREAEEESGIAGLRELGDILSLETLAVAGHEKHGVYVPSHLHLNVTFLLEADPAAPLRCKPDENSQVAWFTPEEAVAASTEPWLQERVYRKLNEKLRKFES